VPSVPAEECSAGIWPMVEPCRMWCFLNFAARWFLTSAFLISMMAPVPVACVKGARLERSVKSRRREELGLELSIRSGDALVLLRQESAKTLTAVCRERQRYYVASATTASAPCPRCCIASSCRLAGQEIVSRNTDWLDRFDVMLFRSKCSWLGRSPSAMARSGDVGRCVLRWSQELGAELSACLLLVSHISSHRFSFTPCGRGKLI
jgi:hypothetical protein